MNSGKAPRILPTILTSAFLRHPDRILFVERKKYRNKPWTYRKTAETVRAIEKLLISRGLQKGDRVALCSYNHPLWAAIFFACAQQGIVLVPLDFNSTDEFIRAIIAKTEAKLLFTSFYKPLAANIGCPTVLVENLEQELSTLRGHQPERPQITEEDLLEIVFTSGSTGTPKGVMIKHRNLIANAQSLCEAVQIAPNQKFLSIVPLSHLLEQTVGLCVPIMLDSRISYPYTIKPIEITRAIREEKITSVVCTPIFLKLLKDTIERGVKKAGAEKGFASLLKFAAPLPAFLKKILFAKVRAAVGRDLNNFFVGGAPLAANIEDFWASIGVTILQGYGLTEGSPLVSVNSLKTHKAHSVGRALPGQKIKITEDGEILAQGDNITSGYYGDQEATHKIFADGWLKTGDIGKLDQDGFLFLTGRRKNMLVGAGGMKIYPEDIEEVLNAVPGVKDSVVIGVPRENADIELTAVLLLREETKEPKQIISAANEHLASHQKIQNFLLWPGSDFPRTPTRKVVRDAVYKQALTLLANGPHEATASNKQTDELCKILGEITGLPAGSITDSSVLTLDLKMDSIKRLEMVSRFEEDLGALLDETIINAKTTVADLRKYIASEEKSKKQNAVKKWPLTLPAVALRLVLQAILFAVMALRQKLVVAGTEHLHGNGPFVFIANHTSHLDTSTILKALPLRIRRKVVVAAAKDYFFTSPGKAFLAALLFNAFPLDRDTNVHENFSQIGKFLDAGWSLIIYPEGTRSQDGKLHPFKKGIGIIAQEMDVPIVPIQLQGNFELLPKGASLPRHGVTTAHIGRPVRFPKTISYIQATEELEQKFKTHD